MAKPITVTDASFDADILGSELPVLVDYWAEWCMPCKAIGPLVAQVAEELDGQLVVAKIDVQSNMKAAMASKVSNIPTLIVFKGGREVGRKVGAGGGIQAIRALVQSHL
ncbi:MAG: thioredoxin [Deltaproteobacteria bacterium]|nr:thioredoxin [Deltaproteobacteria bacterium]